MRCTENECHRCGDCIKTLCHQICDGVYDATYSRNYKIFALSELMDADEVIVSSASNLCIAADEIDGKKVGGKAPVILKKIQDEVLREFLEETN